MTPASANSHPRGGRSIPVVAAVLIALMGSLSPPAGAATADSYLRGFEPSGQFLLEVDGSAEPGAAIYYSKSARQYLVDSPRLDRALLLAPGSYAVETLDRAALLPQPDDQVAIAADAATTPSGKFRIDGDEVVFEVSGQEVRLAAKPPLLGPQTPEKILAYLPEYRRGAAHYKPAESILATLRKLPEKARVVVYFGSWCPHCREMVPRILEVQRELGPGSGIEFDYYGLPSPLGADPTTDREDIHGVPTGIVYRDGHEVGRIYGGSWSTPELALQNILLNSDAAGR